MAGQSWAGIETVHTHCSQWTHSHTHALPTVNSFLMSAGFPCPAGVDQEWKGEGGFRGVHKLLKVWRNQKFFKSFLWYINMKAKPVRDERWDEMRWVERHGQGDTQVKGGSEKRNFVKLEINLRFVCCRSYCAAAAVATLTPAGRQSIFFVCSLRPVVVLAALSNLALARCIINICRSKSVAHFCASY